MEEIETNISHIQAELCNGEAYGMNLLNNLTDPNFEMQTVMLYLNKDVRNVEAAAYLKMTEPLVLFSCIRPSEKQFLGDLINRHRILAKNLSARSWRSFYAPGTCQITAKACGVRKKSLPSKQN